MTRSEQLPLATYNTDKIASGYLALYDSVLADLVDRDVRLLEIGVHNGGSLRLWRDYFPRGVVAGIDLKLPPGLDGEERVRAFAGDQADTAFLSDVAAAVAPDGFDVIIDDGSHFGALTKTTFWHLFEKHLKPGGLYAIEDWGTGYWDDWPDGRSVRTPGLLTRLWRRLRKVGGVNKRAWPAHTHGMVGFVKELIDEQGAIDLTRGTLGGANARGSKFESVLVKPAVVFVRKATYQPVDAAGRPTPHV